MIWKILRTILVGVTCGAVIWVAADIGMFTSRYHNYWYGELSKFEQTYKNQEMLATFIYSQRQWENQAAYNLHALQEAHVAKTVAERKLRKMEYEYYHFMRTLEAIDSEALDKTLERMKKPKLKIPFFNIPLEPTPAECEDGQCEENSSN